MKTTAQLLDAYMAEVADGHKPSPVYAAIERAATNTCARGEDVVFWSLSRARVAAYVSQYPQLFSLSEITA